MIVDLKRPLPDDATPTDAPPSYETLNNPTEHGFPSGKRASSLDRSSKSPLPLSPNAVPNPQSQASSSKSTKGKGRTNWFGPFTSSGRTSREVHSTVLGLVRDLVREHNSSAALGILRSCSDACASQSLSLSSILQEKSVEGHTPLYWAIIKRAPDEDLDDSTKIDDLLTSLLSFSSPLSKSTILELRHACLVTSDQALFQRLRLSPEFSPISGVDQMLLGATLTPDDIDVEDVPGDEGSFAMNFVIVQFQKRMMVTKEIVLEFIARGRLWRLAFKVGSRDGPRTGSWCVELSILENSPPTWVDSRLLIPDPNFGIQSSPKQSPIAQEADPAPDSSSPPSSSPFSKFLKKTKPKPTISLRLHSSSQLESNSCSVITVSLEDNVMGASLQYAGSSYIGSDEKLRGRLEARLSKPEAECIIC